MRFLFGDDFAVYVVEFKLKSFHLEDDFEHDYNYNPKIT
jgi:hypothetical protein